MHERGNPPRCQRCQDAEKEITGGCQDKAVEYHHAPWHRRVKHIVADKIVVQIAGQIHDGKPCHGDAQIGKICLG